MQIATGESSIISYRAEQGWPAVMQGAHPFWDTERFYFFDYSFQSGICEHPHQDDLRQALGALAVGHPAVLIDVEEARCGVEGAYRVSRQTPIRLALLNPQQNYPVSVAFTVQSPGCDQIVQVFEQGRSLARSYVREGYLERMALPSLEWASAADVIELEMAVQDASSTSCGIVLVGDFEFVWADKEEAKASPGAHCVGGW